MASITLSAVSSQPGCFACHQNLRDGLRSLPCGHTLCGQCLGPSVTSSGGMPSKPTQCPRQPHSPSTQPTATQTEPHCLSPTTILSGKQYQRVQSAHSAVPTGGFRFHDNHGRNIVLSNQGLSAHRKDCGALDAGGSIVVSRDPMLLNTLYEVEVEAKTGCRWPLALGAVRRVPDFLTVQFGSFWSESGVFVYRGYVVDPDNTTETYRGKDLSHLPPRSRVGVSVDRSRLLHLHLNGEDQGVVSHNALPDPCFPMMELFGKATTITCLPVTNVS